MDPRDSIFLDFRLPNPTSWFYISMLVTLALFFRFKQVFSLRNWDLVMLFALVPALLFLSESKETRLQKAGECAGRSVLEAGTLSCASGELGPPLSQLLEATRSDSEAAQAVQRSERDVWHAYLALLIGSAYFLIRCLADVSMPRRPPFMPNLSTGGLAFFGLALLAVLSVKALLPPTEAAPDGQATSVMLEKATAAAAEAANQVNRTRFELDPELWRRVIAIAGHVVVVAGLIWTGWRHFQSFHAGVGAAVLYLLLPYTARYTQDLRQVLPAALIVLAFAAYRRPVLAGLILGLASGLAYFPLMLFPAWFGFYRGKGAWRFTAAFGGVLVCILAYVWLDPSLRPLMQSAMLFPDWRAWDLTAKPVGEGLWSAVELHFAYRLPLFIGYVALVVATMFWPSPKNLGHLIAISTAMIIGVQFWYADAGGIYVLWYLPLLILVTIRPNLAARFAPDPETGPSRVRRLWAWLHKRLSKPAHQPVA
jgi:hypothetical protein